MRSAVRKKLVFGDTASSTFWSPRANLLKICYASDKLFFFLHGRSQSVRKSVNKMRMKLHILLNVSDSWLDVDVEMSKYFGLDRIQTLLRVTWV